MVQKVNEVKIFKNCSALWHFKFMAFLVIFPFLRVGSFPGASSPLFKGNLLFSPSLPSFSVA